MIGVEQCFGVAEILAVKGAFGHFHKDARVVVALHKRIHVNLAAGLVHENKRGELA